MKIIFVCTGNTCRSPMAEKIFEKMVDGKDVQVESRGVMCKEGMPMSLNAKIVLKENNYDTSHKSATITKDDIDSADLVITMTGSHKMYIESLFGKSEKVKTLGEYTGNGDVIDPYGGDIYEYRRCARKLSEDLSLLKEVLFGKKEIKADKQ